ncbi:hypothetical protein [Actinomadura rayongensis]|uniref:Uncharacterized protein n=1 Tax=Actinomadura rayongensis TaxID=1429076 RepID=A0A6I4W2S1_9ACTN|nr:hypothetical protein [Actinomadura rayongensis]MXQ63783.1 hypothetical protein [Actinomadura rayongensis]
MLAAPEHGVELHRRGVLYAPDYAANAGGIIYLAEELRGHDLPTAARRIMAIGETLTKVWRTSREQDLPPEEVADRMAEQRIEAMRRLSPRPLPARAVY